jgi:hypothetical protein
MTALVTGGGSAHGAAFTVRYDYYCPQCGFEDVTTDRPDPRKHRTHVCPRLRFLSVPLVRKGTPAKIELLERQDYVGTDHVALDPERGRPIQAVITTRDDGQDTAVYAPTATSKGD